MSGVRGTPEGPSLLLAALGSFSSSPFSVLPSPPAREGPRCGALRDWDPGRGGRAGPSFRAWLSHHTPGRATADTWQVMDLCCGLGAAQVGMAKMVPQRVRGGPLVGHLAFSLGCSQHPVPS